MDTWACTAGTKQSFEPEFDVEKSVQTDFANGSQISNKYARGIFSRGNAAGLTEIFEEDIEEFPCESVKRKTALTDMDPMKELI